MAERHTAIERLSGAAAGFGVGAALACLVPLTAVAEWRDLIPPILVGGAAGALIGLALVPRIPWLAQADGPRAMAGQTVPIGALGSELSRHLAPASRSSLRFAVGLGLGAIPIALVAYAIVGTEPSIIVLGIVAVAGFIGAVACASVLPPFLVARSVRSALAASVWRGAREFERAFGSRHAARGFPTTAEAAGRWLAKHAETEATREIRVELHAMRGEWEAARETLERMATDTPRERFDREILDAMLRYQAGGVADDSASRTAAEAIPPGRDRTEALLSIAAFDARRRLPAGDWSVPLLTARDAIPESDGWILFRDLGWVAFVAVVWRLVPVVALIVALVLGPIVLALVR